MSWVWLLLVIPALLFLATLATGLALLRQRREPSVRGYLSGTRFFNPLWFKGDARPLQQRFVRLLVAFLVALPLTAIAAVALAQAPGLG